MMDYYTACLNMSLAIVGTMDTNCITNLSKNKKRIAKLAIEMVDALAEELTVEAEKREKDLDNLSKEGV